MNRLLRTMLTLLPMAVVPCLPAAAQESNSEQPVGTEAPAESGAAVELQAQSRVIEEITVIAEQTLYSLRLQIEDAEEEVFKLFNELNSSDEFDVKCTNEVYAGSHIPQRDCMAGYLRDAIMQNTQDYLKGIDVQLTRDQVASTVYGKSQEFEAEMTRLILENEPLFQAVLKLTNLVGARELKKRGN